MKQLTAKPSMSSTLISSWVGRKKNILSGVVLTALAIGGYVAPNEVQASFTNVTPSSLKFEGVRYWRKDASDATLGSVGRKKTPAGKKNSFLRVQDAPSGIYKVKVGDPVTISTEKANQWKFTASHSNVKGSASGKGSYKGDITAYKMSIDLGNKKGNLRYETNRHHKHLEAVKHEGSRARLVSAVWILVKGKENKKECYQGDLTVTASDLTVGVGASGCKNSKWKISPESIIAYEIAKVSQWGNDEFTEKPTCSSGFKYETKSSALKPMDRCIKTSYDTVGIECKLLITDKSKNWSVESKSGRDVCKSKKGKKNKGVKCKKSSYNYIARSGRDECNKPQETEKDPFCPAGYDYDKKSTSNKGVDVCELKTIFSIITDSDEGY